MFDWIVKFFKKAKAVKPEVNHPEWYKYAFLELGQKEISGIKHNPRILEYHRQTSLKAKDDETAWCASFVNWCLYQARRSGTNSAMARSFLKFGLSIPLDRAKIGDIVIFSRGSNPSQGHVGFLAEMPGVSGDLSVLGGNQSNSVSVQKYPRSKLLGVRRP